MFAVVLIGCGKSQEEAVLQMLGVKQPFGAHRASEGKKDGLRPEEKVEAQGQGFFPTRTMRWQ